MKEIKLTQGKVALVDDEDFELINQFKWQSQFGKNTIYAVHSVNGKDKWLKIRMHRLIMNPPDNMQVDHINHNGLDNRKENLRIVTHRENQLNRSDQREFIGSRKHGNTFASQIQIKGVKIYLGNYKTAKDASDAYMDKLKTINEK